MLLEDRTLAISSSILPIRKKILLHSNETLALTVATIVGDIMPAII